MLIVLLGTDTARRQKRLEALIAKERAAGADVRTYSDVSFDQYELRSLAENVSLFGPSLTVVISGIGDVAETRDEFLPIAEVLHASRNQFILSENVLPAAFQKGMKTIGVSIESFEGPVKKKEDPSGGFALTDAYSARKRSQAWALYRAGISAGAAPREIHGKLFWSIKTMLLAQTTKTADEAGVHPFVYGKAKTAAKNFSQTELQQSLKDLTAMVHKSMFANGDLESALEAFILRSLEKTQAI